MAAVSLWFRPLSCSEAGQLAKLRHPGTNDFVTGRWLESSMFCFGWGSAAPSLCSLRDDISPVVEFRIWIFVLEVHAFRSRCSRRESGRITWYNPPKKYRATICDGSSHRASPRPLCAGARITLRKQRGHFCWTGKLKAHTPAPHPPQCVVCCGPGMSLGSFLCKHTLEGVLESSQASDSAPAIPGLAPRGSFH